MWHTQSRKQLALWLEGCFVRGVQIKQKTERQYVRCVPDQLFEKGRHASILGRKFLRLRAGKDACNVQNGVSVHYEKVHVAVHTCTEVLVWSRARVKRLPLIGSCVMSAEQCKSRSPCVFTIGPLTCVVNLNVSITLWTFFNRMLM